MAPKPTGFHLPALLHGADYNYEQWLDYPEVLEDDFRLMKEARFNALSIGIFSWAMLEPSEGEYTFDWLDRLMDKLTENDVHAILATPSGARPAWLSEAYPEVRQMSAEGVRAPHAGRHNHCRTSPVYRQKCREINSKLAERYAEHPALFMWHVSNEYGAGWCHCSLCYGAFRDWLKKRYSSLDALNHAWWSTFWSHRYTSWEQIEPVDRSVHGLTLDWQRFTSDQTIDFFMDESGPLRELTPGIPVTTNFMQPDVGLDYWRFAKHLDIVSWDSYPRWHQHEDWRTAARTAFYHDLHRSYKGQPFMLMESTPSLTNWQGVSRPKRPGMHLLASLQAVAHGSNTVQYFQWRQGRGGTEKFHGAVMTHLNSANTRVFKEVREVGMALERLDALRESNVQAEVALVYDFENAWALNHAELPQNEAKDYQKTCVEHYAALWRQGVACDLVSGDGPFEGYKVVIAPMLYLLRPGVAESIESFVKGGGIFVTTYLSGIVNESDLAFLGGFPEPLRRTLGLRVEETDTFFDYQEQRVRPVENAPFPLADKYAARHYADVLWLEGATALALYEGEYYRGSPALTVNKHGDGEAYYQATRLNDDFLRDFYAGLLTRHDLQVQEELPEGVSVQERVSGTQRFTFVMNFSAETQEVTAVQLGLAAELEDKLALEPYAGKVFRQADGALEPLF